MLRGLPARRFAGEPPAPLNHETILSPLSTALATTRGSHLSHLPFVWLTADASIGTIG